MDSLIPIRPLQDRVIVKRTVESGEKMTESGNLYIPDSAKEKPQEGIVLAVGNGRIDSKGDIIPVDVKVGDTVLFGKYSGTEVNIGKEAVLILREDEVMGVYTR